jgi:hypothetical protein
MESRIPVVISGVVSVNAAGSSPGRNSLRMKVFTVALMSCLSINNALRCVCVEPTACCAFAETPCKLLATPRTKEQWYQTLVQFVREQPVAKYGSVIVPFGKDQ